jgi:hypothetical protein
MLKLNRLLYTSNAQVFHDAITPTEAQKSVLDEAKTIIKEYLKVEIRNATVSELKLDKAIEPRFRTQGSWRYGTCVQPAWPLRQQMDWDYGIYLPVSAWESNGPPRAMAQLYFDLVERLLGKLCARKGWKLVSGKDTCIRVEVSKTAHIDLPLYAAREAEFNAIQERVLLKAAHSWSYGDSALTMDSAEIPEQEWEELVHIVLATRKGEWKSSDPETISKWFRGCLAEHGDQLKRICMYLKAWRDLHWPAGDGPTSVCIMIAACGQFQRFERRDDLALEAAARRLGRSFLGEIRCDGVDEGKEDFNCRLTDEQRRHASAKFDALAAGINSARNLVVNTISATQAINMLTELLGTRVPSLPHLIEGDAGEDIRSTPARKVPPPVVRSTQAG